MASKFVAIFALVAVASAQHYQNDYYHQQPQYQQYQSAPALIKTVQPALIKSVQPALIKSYQPTLVKQVHHEEPANYQFNYDVHDHYTGDVKQQQETASNGVISGQYSLIDADGYRRIVDYTADDVHGFNANVRREPVEGHKVVKTIQPAVAVQKYIAQPAVAVHKYAAAPAPQYYSAPAPQYYSAPAPVVQKYIAQPTVAVHAAPAHQYVAQQQTVAVHAAPAHQYYAAPAPAKIAVAHQQHGTPYTHVSFSGPSSNYHY